MQRRVEEPAKSTDVARAMVCALDQQYGRAIELRAPLCPLLAHSNCACTWISLALDGHKRMSILRSLTEYLDA